MYGTVIAGWVAGVTDTLKVSFDPSGPDTLSMLTTTRVNVAVTVFAVSIVTVQGFVDPEHPPVQPLKTDVASGVALSWTEEPAANDAVQVAPQSTPAGVLTTVPPPVPAFVAVSCRRVAKLAVTERFTFITREQVSP